jgi:uncharacterized protein YndB with AHSA1/START domain/heme-degrading monooxygenase HmoA
MADLATEGGVMIARMWRGWVRTERLVEYVEVVERTGMDGYRRTPGNAGAQLLTRDLGAGRSEVITLSWWSDLNAIRAFAGDDVEAAKYYPEDDEYLLDREPMVAHFEVAAPHQLPAAAGGQEPDDPAAGFTVTRVLAGDRGRVFAHFIEPGAFSRWFVVDGYTTPANRVTLDPRPGGTINAVMVPEQGGPEIPFAAAYGALDPPHMVQFAFTDPTELVTITLVDLGQEGTQLTYRNQGAPLRERAQALAGVARMLDALQASVVASRTADS